nr:hypothetical protein BaRGS_004025 [Batillaria attramentaria]
MNVIQCYAPTDDSDDIDKDRFYSRLQSTVEKYPERDITIMMGDLNAKIEQITLVPAKIVSIIKNSYEGQSCKVIHGGQLTEAFQVRTGQMQEKTNHVAAASAQVGLNIHKGKSTILKTNAASNNPITLDGKALEEVEAFTYLGSVIDAGSIGLAAWGT